MSGVRTLESGELLVTKKNTGFAVIKDGYVRAKIEKGTDGVDIFTTTINGETYTQVSTSAKQTS